MTLAISDYPRVHLGKVAEINGMTTADGPWIPVREAFDLTGLQSGVLVRWEEEGLISVVQDSVRSPRRYLKPELEVVAELGTGGPPNLRTVRQYISGQGAGQAAPSANGPARAEQRVHTTEPDHSEGARYLVTLANLLRGQKLVTEPVSERRLRVTTGPDSRGVAIECNRRTSDDGRWWFSWGGGVWLCEADNPTEAVVQVKAALRTVGAP
ncbi:hypothetical protein F8568_046165 [Actinomadura sp. LD22]|uniref:Uncharacterized protein n=1 Tax=Actinomadura physcomitrii TaxID=2650748 RepID=A0A6I4MPC7_9ACTN|nr:hypothetical protein [Actinomadura physcomitrii]MWA07583.1 hypothetical protein [Actinomadura physcomitrii]